ncbi:MAG: divalent metal cation transporter, partial [Gammaproteobacteria bacterium]|nr:divalent metal cation transporter [Gemmatimonadota bacterium]NIU80544.1 divalent metal cation transporter [Gammaproteobacteria bacterium]
MSDVEGSGAPGASFWRSLGPGLLWAAAAIGVSHLVQSTRAGADAGFALAGVIVVALILKYPFFEFGPRYAAATGRSLVEGYRRIGRWALWLYLAITVVTSVIVVAAILLFTGVLFMYALGLEAPVAVVGGVLYIGCGTLLWLGRYRVF